MYKKTRKSRVVKKVKQVMGVAANLERPCTISESIMLSCKEVKYLVDEEGKIQK